MPGNVQVINTSTSPNEAMAKRLAEIERRLREVERQLITITPAVARVQ